MRRPAALVALLLAAALVAACDRAPLEPLAVRVEVVGPDLGVARTQPELALELRVRGAAPGTTVQVNGTEATFHEARGVFAATLTLAAGLNALAVEVREGERTATRDTVYALWLDVRPAPPTALPSLTPVAGASATPLPDGATLFAGGVGPAGGPLATTTRLSVTGVATTGTLATPRAGHSVSLLPSGALLVLGGATSLGPSAPSDFVPTAEVYAGGAGRSVPVEGGGFLRAGHSARVLVTGDGRTLLYVYGGIDASAGMGVAATGTVAILEWTADERLVRLSPPVGAGAFRASAFHAQIDLGGVPARAVALGDADEASRFAWREPGTAYPFDMRRTGAAGLPTPRTAAAVAPLGDGLWLVAGGRTADGAVSRAVEVYAPAAGRGFRLGPEAVLAQPRAHASAAILSGRRIVVVGGAGASGAVLPTPEAFYF